MIQDDGEGIVLWRFAYKFMPYYDDNYFNVLQIDATLKNNRFCMNVRALQPSFLQYNFFVFALFLGTEVTHGQCPIG